MQHLEVSGAVRPLYGSLGVKGLIVFVAGLDIDFLNVFVSFEFCLLFLFKEKNGQELQVQIS